MEDLKNYIRRISTTLGLIFFVLIGVVGFGFGFYEVYIGLSSHNWTTTKGYVISSKIIKNVSGLVRKRTSFVPGIKYKYKVNGKKYTSDVYIYGYTSARFDEAKKIIVKYPKNKQVYVYYKKNNPKTAVLKPGVPGAIFAILIIMLLIIFIGSYMLWRHIQYTQW